MQGTHVTLFCSNASKRELQFLVEKQALVFQFYLLDLKPPFIKANI